MNDLPDQLKSVVQGEVLVDEQTLVKNSRDASIFTMKPQVVVCPNDTNDVCHLVEFVTAEKQKGNNFSITPRSAGTDMSGGVLTQSILLSLTEHFNQIVEIGKEYAVVQPGVYYRDLEKETLKTGQIFPSFPASKNICAVGGIVGNNAGGEKSLAYGKTINYVETIKVVLADGKEHGFTRMREDGLKLKMAQEDFEGEVYRKVHSLLSENHELIQKSRPTVSKNSSGYQIWDVWQPGADKTSDGRPSGIAENGIFDLSKIFVGAQGTLGIMTEVQLGLVPVKNSKGLVIVHLSSFDQIPEVVEKVLSLKPTAFECFDEYTSQLAVKYFDEIEAIVAQQTGSEMKVAVTDLFADPQQLPKLTLLVEFEGENTADISRLCQTLADSLSGITTKIIEDSAVSNMWWGIRHESFNLLRQKVSGKYAAAFIDDLIVEPKYLPEFLPKLYEILNTSQMTFTVAGHIGDGNFHIFPLMDMKNSVEREQIYAIGEKCFDLVLKYHGSTSAEHNDGLIRAPFVAEQFGPEITQIFREIKKIFDPNGIFNPGKKLDVTVEEVKKFFRDE